MEMHANVRRIGNSWGILIPKEIADLMRINENTNLHVDMKKTPDITELFGTLKTNKTMAQIIKEIDEGCD